MRRFLAVAVAMLLTLAIAGPALARPAGVAGKGVYIVVMEQPPAVAYTGDIKGHAATAPKAGKKLDPTSAAVKKYITYLNTQHANAMRAVGADVKNKFYDYGYTVNGFAADLTGAQAAKMSSVANVWFMERDESRELHTENSPSFLGLDAPGGLWSQLGGQGAAGEDIIVGIIDTGIWPEHPSFSDQADLADRPGASGNANRVYDAPSDWHGTCQTGEQWSKDDCNNKLIGARYYRTGAAHSTVIPADYKSARDKDGHGTHTSSTAAGNAGVQAEIFGIDRGTVSGMAPRARIAAYKVCWNAAGCFTSDITRAIDDAVADGVDVINYSIGGSSTSLLTSDAVGFLFAADAGVFVATSAGNSGPGASTLGNPAVVPWLTTVGASTQDRTFEATATLGNAVPFTGASVTEGVTSHKLVDSEDAGSELCIVGALNPAVVSGNIVLCKRGINARVDKSLAVKQAGGLGMILYNDVSDAQALVTDNHWLPSVHIKKSDGETIKTYIDTAGALATAEISEGDDVPDADAPYMADFSSRGPNGGAMDIIKPDVTAPGVNILAGNSPTAFLGRPGQLFQSISGTSMSSPHVAGIAALLVQAHPGWTPAMIKSAMMTTGHQDVTKEDKLTAADPFDLGGGHIVPNSAVDPGLAYNAGLFEYLAFLCGATSGVGASTCAFLAANGYSFDASDLNLASIGIAELVGSQTVERTVTSVTDDATWTASYDGLTGYTVDLPDPFFLAAGDDATYEVTFTRDTAPLDEWVFGAITLSDGSGYEVRSPVALRATVISAPSTVTQNAAPEDGSTTWEVKVGYDGTLSASAYGAVADDALAGEVVSQDPDQDIATGTFTSGVNLYDFILTAATQYWAGGTFDATTEAGSDLDVFLLAEMENGTAGFQYPGDLVASSADGDSEEIVELRHPAPDNYRLIVHGWFTPDGASTYTLHRWDVGGSADTASFNAAPTDGEPLAVDPGDVVEITLNWSGLTTTGVQYRGIVDYDDGTDVIGSTAIIINR